ncbi:RagB/SusD family nutrient uptake outer membrane protein [Chitinophaga sp. MM2321]|uniref:RagB/SusD family nutrient uptake outer membrane protein n=1 Tax=Chitinophaga sp. MM2321 TaxID=3137178 RepID=UPI0032D57C46
MKITQYIIHASLACLLVVAYGCNKKLDVLPTQQITPDQITTSEDVKAVLFGSYNSLQHFNTFGERNLLISDLLGGDDELDWVGTFANYKAIFMKTQDRTSSIAEGMWGRSYIVIAGVNTVLEKIQLVDTSEQKGIAAEAKFIRGITYFELVNFFGQPYSAGNAATSDAVPIVLDPVTVYDPQKDKKARDKVAAVYDQVIKDLTEAAADLPESNESGRASKYSALAFLARVYMNQGKYPEAAAAANDVVTNGGFGLAGTFDKAFNNISNSSEDVFAIQQSKQSNAGTSNNGMATFYAAKPTGRGDVQVLSSFLDLYDDGDARKSFVYDGTSISGIDGTYTTKWRDQYKAVPVIRLAEMLLTRAEANFRAGGAPVGGVTPLDDVNEVRARSNAAPLGVLTANDIVDERFRELAFEGDRLWTIKRLKMKVGSLDYNAPLLVLPVPQSERDVNPDLTQNEGY